MDPIVQEFKELLTIRLGGQTIQCLMDLKIICIRRRISAVPSWDVHGTLPCGTNSILHKCLCQLGGPYCDLVFGPYLLKCYRMEQWLSPREPFRGVARCIGRGCYRIFLEEMQSYILVSCSNVLSKSVGWGNRKRQSSFSVPDNFY